MLPRALSISRIERGQLIPDRLMRNTDAQYLGYAERMLKIYRNGIGRTRQELHRSVREVFSKESNCPLRRMDAFAKLLDDKSKFDGDRRNRAAKLRKQVFELAAEMHPLVRCPDTLFSRGEAEGKSAIAAQIGKTWDEIDRALFADVIDFHRLLEFPGYADAPALLARYNVAQVQAALFDAVSLMVSATEDFKTILRYAKLAGLMHTIRVSASGRYELRFDGPASILRATRRYGAAMARFLPALIACRGWRMHAMLRTRRGWNVSLNLCADDGLRSHLPAPEEFDSCVEQEFMVDWGLENRDGWQLTREGDILVDGQKAFVPDFTLKRDDGRAVLLEIVGFWTQEYLEAKAKTLQTFSNHNILLAVGRDAAERWPELKVNVIHYKNRLRASDVLERLQEPEKNHLPAQ